MSETTITAPELQTANKSRKPKNKIPKSLAYLFFLAVLLSVLGWYMKKNNNSALVVNNSEYPKGYFEEELNVEVEDIESFEELIKVLQRYSTARLRAMLREAEDGIYADAIRTVLLRRAEKGEEIEDYFPKGKCYLFFMQVDGQLVVFLVTGVPGKMDDLIKNLTEDKNFVASVSVLVHSDRWELIPEETATRDGLGGYGRYEQRARSYLRKTGLKQVQVSIKTLEEFQKKYINLEGASTKELIEMLKDAEANHESLLADVIRSVLVTRSVCGVDIDVPFTKNSEYTIFLVKGLNGLIIIVVRNNMTDFINEVSSSPNYVASMVITRDEGGYFQIHRTYADSQHEEYITRILSGLQYSCNGKIIQI